MNRVQMCVESLIDAIRQGETYQRYLRCEEKVQEQPEIKKQIDEFRAAVYRMNNEEHQDLFEEIDQFERKYQDFRRIPIVNEYLEAELDVCKLLQRVEHRIHEGVNVQIPNM